MNLKRDFVLNILFLLAVNLLIKPFFIFGIDRSVQNEVGPAEYGMYFSMLNFTYLFQIVIDFGIQNFNNRNIAQNSQLLNKYFSHIMVLKFGLAIIYSLIVIFAAILFNYSWEHLNILLLLVCNQIFISFTFYFRSNISGLQHYFTDSLLSVLDRVLLIIICSVLLWANPFGQHFRITWFVYAQTATYSATALIAFSQVYKHLKAVKLKWNKAFQWWLLRESFPYALAIFLMSVYTRIDGVMIERMIDANESGLYAAAYRLLDASNMIGLLFAGLLLPMYARQLKDGTPVLQLSRFSFKTIWAASAALASGSFAFRNELMHLLYNGANDYSGELLGWLMLSFPAVCTMYIFGALLTSNGNLRQMNWLFGFSVVFNIVCNFILIAKFKALGGAYSTLITQYIVAIAQIFIAQRTFKWRTNFKIITQVLSFAALCFAVFYLCKNTLFYTNNPTNWMLQFATGAILTILASFLFKLIDVKRTLDVFRN
ncbi:MAG: hypothetical protein RI894_1303 [Bacteroidota bacterium]|jgi:O-antigen/teichoic acid export membrane protein